MRRDYLRYFAEPTVYSVVGIKMLQGDCKYCVTLLLIQTVLHDIAVFLSVR